MPEPVFIVADARVHREELVELNVEFLSWVFGEIEKSFVVSAEQAIGMRAGDYVRTAIEKVCGHSPPEGIFYLVNAGTELAGMGGLRPLGDGVAEIKRLYVRPKFRGMRLGDALLARLLSDARAFGYQRVFLDTAPFMRAAHGLYERNGFFDRPAYAGVEVPPAFHAGWRFMERVL